MGVLSSLTSALTAFNPSSVNVKSDEDMYKAICKIMGKFPVLVAWTMRKKSGLPLNYGSKSLGYVENFMKMMFEQPNEEFVVNLIIKDALDKLLILHADHEQNCSTSTVRMVGSSHAGYLRHYQQEFLHFGDLFMEVQIRQFLKCWKQSKLMVETQKNIWRKLKIKMILLD